MWMEDMLSLATYLLSRGLYISNAEQVETSILENGSAYLEDTQKTDWLAGWLTNKENRLANLGFY